MAKLPRRTKKGAERKTRSDKKRDVKPTISILLKDEIFRLAFMLDTPAKDVAEYLTCLSILDREIADQLSPYFKRDVRLRNTVFFGSPENPSLREADFKGSTDRLSIRFQPVNYENVHLMASTLDVTPSRATAILLGVGIKHPRVMDELFDNFKSRIIIDDAWQGEARKLLRYVRHGTNLFGKHSWRDSTLERLANLKVWEAGGKNRQGFP